jgi:hypothetical protein
MSMVSNLGASKTATGWRQHVCLTLRVAIITTSLPHIESCAVAGPLSNKLAWLDGNLARPLQLRLSSLKLHPTLVVLESCPGGLHGDNGAAFIGSAVGCDVLNHVTRTPVDNVWNCTDSHLHATLCPLQRWKMGRGGSARVCVCGCTVAWPPCQSLRATKLSLLAEATLARPR